MVRGHGEARSSRDIELAAGGLGDLADGRLSARADVERFSKVGRVQPDRRVDERLGDVSHVDEIA